MPNRYFRIALAPRSKDYPLSIQLFSGCSLSSQLFYYYSYV
jgi:hypothetical protein